MAVGLGPRTRCYVLPAGVGQPLPAGSLVVMQIHYNLLLGDKPVPGSSWFCTPFPASTPLRPLSLALMPAPPDIPCPTGVTGPLCSAPPRWPTCAALRPERHRVRRHPRIDLRAQRGRPAGRAPPRRAPGPSTPGRDHRAAGRPHAPARPGMTITLNPGTPKPEDDPRRPELQLPLPEGVRPLDADPLRCRATRSSVVHL